MFVKKVVSSQKRKHSEISCKIKQHMLQKICIEILFKKTYFESAAGLKDEGSWVKGDGSMDCFWDLSWSLIMGTSYRLRKLIISLGMLDR